MLNLNKLLFENQDIMNQIAEKQHQKENLEIEIKSLMVEQENTLGKISEQKVKTNSIIQVLNADFKELNINFAFNEDFTQLHVKENQIIVDGFIFNDESNDWENDNYLKGKFSSKNIHINYCAGVEFIYQQLDKLK